MSFPIGSSSRMTLPVASSALTAARIPTSMRTPASPMLDAGSGLAVGSMVLSYQKLGPDPREWPFHGDADQGDPGASHRTLRSSPNGISSPSILLITSGMSWVMVASMMEEHSDAAVRNPVSRRPHECPHVAEEPRSSLVIEVRERFYAHGQP